MGMDVYGKEPRSEEGKYFRASVWSWRPLATMLEDLYPQYASKIEYLHTNDGDGLDAEDADALGKLMLHDERIAAYVENWNAKVDALPLEKCDLCKGTGVRTDDVGVKMGMVERNTCNGCDGKGQRTSWQAAYRMEHQHTIEFARFIAASGGFEIC